jgi:ribonuclease HI
MLQAATEAVKIAGRQGFDKVIIKTDSQFLVNSMTQV